MFRWLTHVQEQLMLNKNGQSLDISWSAFNACLVKKQTGMEDVSVLLPLSDESSKRSTMIKHGMDVIKTAVYKVNKGQTPVIVDQLLYASANKVQWNWKDIYGETQFVVTMGPFHSEMAALKTLCDWLEYSGWCSALLEAEVASSRTAQSLLHFSHVSRTRSAHQVRIVKFF